MGYAYFIGIASGIEFVLVTVPLIDTAKPELALIYNKLRKDSRLRVQISTHTDNSLSSSNV